jgi:hypothetical protein
MLEFIALHLLSYCRRGERACAIGWLKLGPTVHWRCNTHELITNLKCPLCIPSQSQNHCCDLHNVVDITVTAINIKYNGLHGGHSDQTSQYINMQRNNTAGPYRQASTAQAEPTVGNEPNSQSHPRVLPS